MQHASRPSYTELAQHDEFVRRHIGPAGADQSQMLKTLGLSSLDALIDKVIPKAIRSKAPLALGEARSEADVLKTLRQIADKNKVFKTHIGTGYYDCHTPTVILRNLLESPAWYTAYTPYQPEISQGRLEVLLNFQTMVSDLTGMEIANASLLDEATAAAEAMTLCRRVAKNKSSKKFFVSADCHPQTIDVVRTRAAPIGIEVVVGNEQTEFAAADYFGILLQYPGSSGEVRDPASIIKAAHEKGALVAVATDLLALTLLKPPGELGADVVIGSTQRFGVPMGFGGPHAAFFATRDLYKRDMPGRLVGVSVDAQGNSAYRLALQTREQHIRREKASSNICTAQALLAMIAAMYASYHGPAGLKIIAKRVHRLTATLAFGLRQLGVKVETTSFFDTIFVDKPGGARALHDAAGRASINLRDVDAGRVGISLDETTTPADIERLWSLFGAAKATPEFAKVEPRAEDHLPPHLVRTSPILAHPVFNTYHSETDMLRYLRSLADKDLALDRTMIPLGSCTMKLNATTEMIPVTWKEFGGLHPFAPREQTEGYTQLIAEIEQMLCACTGYDAMSLQPNSGAQGEYAGLLAIRGWHQSRGEGQRNICLIPSSAHGTNPATAQLVGMQVVVVACDSKGNVDVADLKAKAEKHSAALAAIMITYPSTHGVFEESVTEICDIVHKHGGQVYIDGANMNAQVGLAHPGHYGGDVSHLNLHKTFCIPHGGGGPGIGPIGVRAHLAPFMPGHRLFPKYKEGGRKDGAVAAAPWGSASILPITWVYIMLMGREGLRRASEVAILNANYIAHRLAPHFPVLYTGTNGMVAHECILDLRPLKDETGISGEDVAKRLIDYGFHAPTMSFPVPGTLMIEPTESEPKSELDRFCDAMIRIREEIAAVASGAIDRIDNPLKNAPHTAMSLTGEWRHPYSREQAVFPVTSLKRSKYWPPVGRVDNVHGDRVLVCTCPPMSDYEQAEYTGT
jgi:glycine dehydrogenase